MKNQSTDPKNTLAVFDFDGTITTRDTLLSFLFYAAGIKQTLKKMALLSPALLSFVFHRISRQDAKEKILTSFFAGMSRSQIKELGESFALSTNLRQLIRPSAQKRLAWHRRQKHTCVLITASIDAYTHPWGKAAGFDHIISSRLETTPSGNITGRLLGLNCWGPEKVRRLKEIVGPLENHTIYAYGDSRGDQELLAAADHPFYRQMPHPQPLPGSVERRA